MNTIFGLFFFFCTIVTPIVSQSPTCTPGFFPSGNVCRKCTIGSYCPNGKTQISCPPGAYTDLYEQLACRRCRNGWYQTRAGQTICLRCGLGQFCPTTTSLPQACPPGTYGDLYGQIKCRPCPKGYYNIQSGATYCTKCPLDVECSNSTVLPKLCATGYYNPFYAQTKCRRLTAATGTIHLPGCFNVNA